MSTAQSETGFLLVTHAGLGQAMLAQATQIFSIPEGRVQLLEVINGVKTDIDELRASIRAADQGAGVLVMTDLPGATPSNLAGKANSDCCRIISGLNLPMLIRAWTYRARPLDEVVQLALDGARMAIVELE